eukprot:scaffold216278_cov13-Tisochrysis_lutea.AAC.1
MAAVLLIAANCAGVRAYSFEQLWRAGGVLLRGLSAGRPGRGACGTGEGTRHRGCTPSGKQQSQGHVAVASAVPGGERLSSAHNKVRA